MSGITISYSVKMIAQASSQLRSECLLCWTSSSPWELGAHTLGSPTAMPSLILLPPFPGAQDSPYSSALKCSP